MPICYDPAANPTSSLPWRRTLTLVFITRIALLLPDATVWFAGGNPTRGTYEQHMEIYKPPYLFNANGTRRRGQPSPAFRHDLVERNIHGFDS